MRRAVGGLLATACTVLLAGCAPTFHAADIEGTDLQSRYPLAVMESHRGLARAAAVALSFFSGWFLVDVTLRGGDQDEAVWGFFFFFFLVVLGLGLTPVI